MNENTNLTTEATVNQEVTAMEELFETVDNQAVDSLDGKAITEEKKEKPAPRDKGERFVELAVIRTNKVIDAIDSLGKLASKKNYSYNKEQVDKIFQAIQKELEDIKYEFDREKSEPVKKRFSLD